MKVGKWVHRFKARVIEIMAVKSKRVVVVNETVVNFAGRPVYLWVALDPETTSLA